MPTLIDISKEAGVSIASVSLYINGKAEGRISKETQEIIQKAIEKIGYKIPKKKFIKNNKNNKTIAIFWSVNAKQTFIGSIFSGFQDSIINSKNSNNYDFVIHPYKSNELYKKKDLLIRNEYYGAIIANTTLADMQYLRSITLDIPVVLLNRKTPSHHSIYVDNDKIAHEAANFFKQKGVKSIATVLGIGSSMMISERFVKFIEACKTLNISISNDFQFQVDDSVDGGYQACEKYLMMEDRPDAIFTSTDYLALGFENRLKRTVKNNRLNTILCFGFESPDLINFSTIPISSIDLPVYEMAKESVNLLIKIIEEKINQPTHKELNYIVNDRS